MINISKPISTKLSNSSTRNFRSLFYNLGKTQSFYKYNYTVDDPKFNRYLQVIPSLGIHLSLGSIYSFSLLNNPLTKVNGVVASTASDWALGSILPIASLHLVMQGVGATITGKFQKEVGVRLSTFVGSFCYLTGWSLFAIGVKLHMLPLCYLGYGLIAGMGIGISYIPPVVNLMRWFPDRKGLASGIVSMGFGGAAMLTSNFIKELMDRFSKAPLYAGSAEQISQFVSEIDKHFFLENREIVYAGKSDIMVLPDSLSHLSEGWYYVGTGSTGLPETLASLGIIYSSLMMVSSFSFRRPPDDFESRFDLGVGAVKSCDSTPAAEVFKTRDFYLMYMIMLSTASFGISNLYCSANYMNEIFKPLNQEYVTNSFIKNYVILLSLANLFGRVGYGALSEFIGRKNTFYMITMGTVPIYYVLPQIINMYIANPDPVYIQAFIGCTMLSTSFLGATYALLPSYEADRFGAKDLNIIHGRMLTAGSIAAVAGPRIAVTFRNNYQSTHVGDPGAQMSLQYNDYFMTSAYLMIGSIFCNMMIKDMTKDVKKLTLEDPAVKSIANMKIELEQLKFEVQKNLILMEEKEEQIKALEKKKKASEIWLDSHATAETKH